MRNSRKPNNPVIHMIGNAHIDPVWLWTREEGKRVVLETMRTVVALMRENSDMTFACAQAQAYLWVEESDPGLFNEIQSLVAEGRWHIVGGMWVQPDCNLPSGESFVRHLLYSQRYFQSRFGRKATTGYNVDSFGHAGTLPQILSKAGISSYVYFRPDPEQEIAIDEDLFWWQSLDGSRVLACRPPNHYCTWAGEIKAWIVNSVVHAPERVGAVLCFFGVGDHGGGPTRENIASIRAMASRLDMPPIIFGSLEDFFEQARSSRSDYSVRRADLQHHAPGCYSVHSGIKRWNRKAEQRLVAIEKASAILSVLSGDSVTDTAVFENAWRKLLFNQFHDILAGTSIRQAYDEAKVDFAELQDTCSAIEQRVLTELAATTGSGEGDGLFIFNPCSWPRRAYVEVATDENIVPRAGESLAPNQRTWDEKVLVRAELPALGGTCLLMKQGSPGEPVQRLSDAVGASENTLESKDWRLRVDPSTGEWTSLYDKTAEVEVLANAGNALVVLDDPSDTWSHGVRGYYNELGRFARAEVTVLEEGPLRASLLVKRYFGRSSVQERVSLYAGERAIEVHTQLDWHETRKALKISFPLALAYPVCTYEAPYGVVRRVANGEEEPGQTWVDASGTVISADGRPLPYGVSLINESKYGFDMKSYGHYSDPDAWLDLRMTVLRSPPYAFHDPKPFDPWASYEFIDQGSQSFTYWVLPHRDSWQEANTVRIAHEKNAPSMSTAIEQSGGYLPEAWSFMEVEEPHVEVGALKVAENGTGLILRLVETAGKDCTATLRFPLWLQELQVPMGHYEIKTLRVTLGDGVADISEVNLLEETENADFRAQVSVAPLRQKP